MSRNPPSTLALSLQIAETKAALVAKNKEQARIHLLQIQLLLARQPVQSKK